MKPLPTSCLVLRRMRVATNALAAVFHMMIGRGRGTVPLTIKELVGVARYLILNHGGWKIVRAAPWRIHHLRLDSRTIRASNCARPKFSHHRRITVPAISQWASCIPRTAVCSWILSADHHTIYVNVDQEEELGKKFEMLRGYRERGLTIELNTETGQFVAKSLDDRIELGHIPSDRSSTKTDSRASVGTAWQ
jgi:hypothetical protein